MHTSPSFDLAIANAAAGYLVPDAAIAQARFVNDDYALNHWLAVFSNRVQTYRSYAAESLRFRIFLECVHPERAATEDGMWLLRDATEADVRLYEAVLSGVGSGIPQIVVPDHVLGRYKNPKKGVVKQPFEKLLKRASVNLALSILNTMYEHWRLPLAQGKMPYVLSNPVARVKKATTRGKSQAGRSIPIEAISAMRQSIDATIEDIKKRGDSDAGFLLAKYERRRWILALLFGLWGRREEIVGLRMGAFVKDFDGWKVTLMRKGQKEQDLPVAGWVIESLKRYRVSLGLSELPSVGDAQPAIQRIRTRKGLSSSTTVTAELLYQEVKELASETAEEISFRRLLPDLDEETRVLLIDRLSKFSPHWFRHTGATVGINTGAMSLLNASKFLGHGSTSITASMYHHVDDDQIRSGIDSVGGSVFLV